MEHLWYGILFAAIGASLNFLAGRISAYRELLGSLGGSVMGITVALTPMLLLPRDSYWTWGWLAAVMLWDARGNYEMIALARFLGCLTLPAINEEMLAQSRKAEEERRCFIRNMVLSAIASAILLGASAFFGWHMQSLVAGALPYIFGAFVLDVLNDVNMKRLERSST